MQTALNWIEDSLENDYGRDRWRRMPESEKLFIIANFGKNLEGAIIFIKKFKKKRHEGLILLPSRSNRRKV